MKKATKVAIRETRERKKKGGGGWGKVRLAGLDVLVVDSNEDSLSSLDGNNSTSTLLSVDGAFVSAEDEVLSALKPKAIGTKGTSIVEASDQSGSLRARELES